MPELSLSHIDQITRDIRGHDIVFSHLVHDLIDHVCCDVEYEMQNGLSFSEAYGRVKQKMGPRRLQEIQEETLYSVDTKYRYMKTTMKISGVAGTVIFATAALFKIQHWPGAGIMLTMGALILAFVFLPSALSVLWKETHSKNKLILFISSFLTGMLLIMGTVFKVQHWPAAGLMLAFTALFGIFLFIPSLLVNRFSDQMNKHKRPVYILGAAGLMCYAVGMLFKIQHWPLASTFMVLGVLILCVIVFPWYTWITYRDETHVQGSFIFIIIGTVAIIVPGAMVNLNLQNNYEKGYYPQLGQQHAVYNYLYNSNNSLVTRYHDSINYSQIEQLHSKTAALLNTISNIQVKMVQESEGKPGMPAISGDQIKQTETGPEIQYMHLSKPFHPDAVKNFLLPGCSSRQEIDASLTDYNKFISGLSTHEDFKKYLGLLEPSICLPAVIPEEGGISLMSGLNSLELLKTSVLSVESYILTTVTGK